MFAIRKSPQLAWLMLAALGLVVPAYADVIADWNIKADELIAAAKVGPATTRRAVAIVQTSVYGAVNAITQHYPAGGMEPGTAIGGSIDAAVASANRVALLALLPAQKTAIEAAYQSAIAKVAPGAAKTSGIAVGQKSAAAILAIRADDLANPADDYRQPTMPEGHVPVPTAETTVTGPMRTPWLMSGVGALRPAPPPAESTPTWARDYNEVKNFGGKSSKRRTAEQTAIARFWEDATPAVFYGLVRSVANQRGREVTRNARLYMAVAQSVDDATMAVMEAKYAYNLWRPVTAIHNADKDESKYTEPDAAWAPLGITSEHPEYPCTRCIEAATVGATLKAETGDAQLPMLITTSRTAPGVTRNWNSVEDMIREVADARVFDGADYRTSTVVGMAMGQQIGALAATQLLSLAPSP